MKKFAAVQVDLNNGERVIVMQATEIPNAPAIEGKEIERQVLDHVRKMFNVNVRVKVLAWANRYAVYEGELSETCKVKAI